MYLKIILSTCLFLILGENIFCQQDNKEHYSNNSENEYSYSENYNSTDDSIYYYFSTYFKIHLDIGFSKDNDIKVSAYSRRFFTNVSYSVSNFIYPLDISPTQVGLYSELGLDNISPYLNFGPEARIDKNFYLIPCAGISLIPFPKDKNEDLAFIYYLGISAGYNVNLGNSTYLTLELASDFIKFKKDGNNIYLKIGLDFNLLYSL